MKIGILLLLLDFCLSVPVFENHEVRYFHTMRHHYSISTARCHCVLSSVFCTLQTMPTLRRSVQQSSSTTRRRSKRECVVFLIHKQYEGNAHVDQPLECELQGADLNGKKYKMVRVKGLTTSWARQNNVTSGVTTIYSPDGAVIDDQTNELILPSGTAIKVRTSCSNNGCLLQKPSLPFPDTTWSKS